MAVKRRLSQTLGQIRKGFAVDTYEGGFPVNYVTGEIQAKSYDSVLALTPFTEEVQEITEGLTNPDVPRCIIFAKNLEAITGDVIIKGTDWADRRIEEIVSMEEGENFSETWQAFKTVDHVTVPALEDLGENLIQNGDFSTGDLGEAWGFQVGDATVGVENVGHTGDYSVVLTMTAGMGPHYAYLWQSVHDLTEGDTYPLSFYFQTTGGTAEQFVCVLDGDPAPGANYWDGTIWQPLTGPPTVTEGFAIAPSIGAWNRAEINDIPVPATGTITILFGLTDITDGPTWRITEVVLGEELAIFALGVSDSLGLPRPITDEDAGNVVSIERVATVAGEEIFVLHTVSGIDPVYGCVTPSGVVDGDMFRINYYVDVF